MNDFVPALKDRAIFLAWVSGLILIALLLWSFSYSFRAELLMRVTNRALNVMKIESHLSAPLPHRSARTGPLGCWYSLSESDSLFFVFTIMREGILVPCGAEISENGEVITVIPLGSHARQVIERIPQSIIQIYVRRIEALAAGVIAANTAVTTGALSGLGE